MMLVGHIENQDTEALEMLLASAQDEGYLDDFADTLAAFQLMCLERSPMLFLRSLSIRQWQMLLDGPGHGQWELN